MPITKAEALLAISLQGRKSIKANAKKKMDIIRIVFNPKPGSMIKVAMAKSTRMALLSQSFSKSPKASITTKTKFGFTPRMAKLLFWINALKNTATKLVQNTNIPKGFDFKACFQGSALEDGSPLSVNHFDLAEL